MLLLIVVTYMHNHVASFSTLNSMPNTSLRKPIRMQGFIQLCDSNQDCAFEVCKVSPVCDRGIFQNISSCVINP